MSGARRLLAGAILVLAAPAAGHGSTVAPVPDFGAVVPVPGAANLPDPALVYRTVFNVTKASSEASAPNPGLVRVARFFNLLATRGIRPAKGDVVVVVHGAATPLVMTSQAHQAKYGTGNPNLPLIAALAAVGAEVHVCGQALHAQGIRPGDVASPVIVDLGAATTLATLQLRGFALIPD